MQEYLEYNSKAEGMRVSAKRQRNSA
jgi:hypothetical protein